MNEPRFLPWIRTGLARGVGEVDQPDGGRLPRRGEIKATVDLVDSRGQSAGAEVPFALAGAGDVLGFDAGQIIRQVPEPGTDDAESNYFPFVELVSPDLPWLLTPAQATAGENRLRPWLVLVCVEQRDGIHYEAQASPLPVLTVPGAEMAAELPDLTESWAWAHVQSMVPAPQIEGELAAGSGAVTARLICPRRLLPGRSYRAALVPAFDLGVQVGLGQDVSDATDLGPAWDLAAPPPSLPLPVYATWTFATEPEPGDFEELARRLEPDREGGRLGYRVTDLEAEPLLPPSPGPTDFEYEGPLVDPGSTGAGLGKGSATWFRTELQPRLEAAADRPVVPPSPGRSYRPDRDDPVIGPPLYGSLPVDRYTVPSSGWLRELNLGPAMRAAAGLGAAVVRAHQHEFLAAAWDQAGDLAQLQDELNRQRLSAEVGRSHAARFAALTDEGLLEASARLQVHVPHDRGTASSRVAVSAVVPTGMTTAVFARQSRPGAVVAKRAGARPHQTPVGRRATRSFVGASVSAAARPDDLEPVARFGATFVVADTVTSATTYTLGRIEDPADTPPLVAHDNLAVIETSASDDVTAVASSVRQSLDPMPAIVGSMQLRVDGIDLDPAADLPTRTPVGPRFLEPLFPKFRAMGAELVVPGIDEVEPNRVRLLAVNEAWIAAFCAGANHEWIREALWNEYPADPRSTAFSAFWPRLPPGTPDLASDLHTWVPVTGSGLADHVGAAGSSTVLLVRGDLVRRYPETEFMLVEPAGDGSVLDEQGNLPRERTTWPDFRGRLDADTVFVGFDVDPDVVLSDGYYLGLQEPVVGPRFGLDAEAADTDPADYGAKPSAWADLAWSSVAATPADLEALSHVSVSACPWLDGDIDGFEWPRNSAHLAAITFQQPFRLLLPATELIPAPDDGGVA